MAVVVVVVAYAPCVAPSPWCFRMTKQRQPFDTSGFVAVAGEKEEETKFRSFGSQEWSWSKRRATAPECRLRRVAAVQVRGDALMLLLCLSIYAVL